MPQEVKSAAIIFYDRTGQVVNTFVLKDRGQGIIHLYAPDLSSGMYTYSLIADGKVMETKSMIKAK